MARAHVSMVLVDKDTSAVTHSIPRSKSWLSFVHGDSLLFVTGKHL